MDDQLVIYDGNICNLLEHILDIAMSPVVTFNLGNRRDVASTEGGNLGGHQDQDQSQDQQSAAKPEPRKTHVSHVVRFVSAAATPSLLGSTLRGALSPL